MSAPISRPKARVFCPHCRCFRRKDRVRGPVMGMTVRQVIPCGEPRLEAGIMLMGGEQVVITFIGRTDTLKCKRCLRRKVKE